MTRAKERKHLEARLAPSGRASALSLALSCALLLSNCTAERGVSEDIALAEGLRLERTLEAGRSHVFGFELEAERYLRLEVEQLGLDVLVLLFDPEGRLLFEVDSPTGSRGREVVIALTPSSGRYRLEVRPFEAEAAGIFALEVVELRPARGDDRRRAASAAALASAEWRRLEEDFEAAAAGYERALPDLEALGDRENAARARWHLGEALVELGELSRASKILRQAADEFRALGDGVGEARALNDLGDVWRELGETGRAHAAHRRSLELYRAAGIESGEGSALNNLGLVAEATGDLAGALELYEAALEIWRRLERHSAEATTLQNLGGLYALIGRDAEALDLHRQAVEVLQREGRERHLGSALVALGWAHHLAGENERALERYDEAIELARRLGDPVLEAGALDRRGTALRELGRTAEARAAYSSALETFRAAGLRVGIGHTLANLGWLALAEGDGEPAAEALREALEILSAAGDPNGEVYALVGLARAARLDGELERARRTLERAVELIEELRSAVRGRLSRSYFLAVRYDAVEELVTLLMELHQRDSAGAFAVEALEVVERSRARTLLEDLGRGAVQGEDAGSASERRRHLLAEIRALEERRMSLADRSEADPRVENLERLLRQRWLEVERLEDDPLIRTGAAGALLTAREMQDLLDRETLLIVYFLAEPRSFAWTVDRGAIEVHPLPGRERIEDLARLVAASAARSGEMAFAGQAERSLAALARAILEPLSPRLAGHRRLAVVADGALHAIPFAAVPLAASPEKVADPLLRRHEIVTLPAVSVLAHQRRILGTRPPADATVAVFADPVFNPLDERLGGIGAVEPSFPRDLERAVDLFGGDPPERLPSTAAEAAAILELVPEEKRLSALGFEADRELAESGELSRYRIVHFATHGLLHPVHPQLSGIVLSLYDEKGQPRNGFLRAHEIAALDLHADLVVLSACRTRLGREIRGEGLVGLPQAFFRAGARRVIVSSWPVSDLATAELMGRFYRHLLEDGLPPAAALRRAQLEMLADERWRAPYYWAAFSLEGDWR